MKFNLEDIGGTPEEIKAKIKKVQDDIKQATEDAKETEDVPGDGAMVTVFTDKAIKADASLKGLNVTLSDLQRELRLATAVAAQGAQVLANDLAAAADKAAQDEQRRKEALSIAVIAGIADIARNRKSKTINHKGHEGTQGGRVIRKAKPYRGLTRMTRIKNRDRKTKPTTEARRHGEQRVSP